MKDLVTIIVPIYNAEQNIKRCVDSILNQDYKNLESYQTASYDT